ncbi:hypothetical protein FPQ18DRAFT_387743 [Pyronema domesticum]|nr:hypothetical protein FPQ18DRAFT_387743 [Pyronema domesticum]
MLQLSTLRPFANLWLLFLLLSLVAATATDSTLEKRQTSSAPSFRFSVHTHSESALKYAISPTYGTKGPKDLRTQT